MLSSTEKILSVVVLALTLAVGFSLMQYGSAMDEMAQLRSEQAEHVDMVNKEFKQRVKAVELENIGQGKEIKSCLLYTSPSPRDDELSRMPSSA